MHAPDGMVNRLFRLIAAESDLKMPLSNRITLSVTRPGQGAMLFSSQPETN